MRYPAGLKHFLAINAQLAAKWPVVTAQKDLPPNADERDGRPDKLELLELLERDWD